jgi:hypothetical protein
MNPRLLAACLLFFALALSQACGTGATRCTASSECQGQGVCQGGFCTDLSSLGGPSDGDVIDRDPADAAVPDAGPDPDAGDLNNGRG